MTASVAVDEVRYSGRAASVAAERTYGMRHTKFAASSMLLVPVDLATVGYAHSCRVRSTVLPRGGRPRSGRALSLFPPRFRVPSARRNYPVRRRRGNGPFQAP